jgi:UDP-glucose 4-epimerase
VLVAAASNAAKILGWRPQHSELESIIRDAWNWHSKGDRKN